MEQWITQEIERTELGDKRRTKRLIKIVENLSAKPEASVRVASGTWAETKATYDFWDSPYIQPSMIRQGHIDATVERIVQQQQVVLAIQDTTELNYTSHKALSGIGYLDSSYAQGLKVHSVFTVSVQGVPLGIIEQQVWARIEEELGKSEQRKQKSTADKESQKWLNGLKATDSIIPPSVQVVTIADREADIYDLFACSRRPGSEFLIRASQNRCLDSSQEHLWETMASQPSQGKMTVQVNRSATQAQRTATLDIRYTTIAIAPPQMSNFVLRKMFIMDSLKRGTLIDVFPVPPLLRGASRSEGSPQVERLAWVRGDQILCSFIKNWYQAVRNLSEFLI